MLIEIDRYFFHNIQIIYQFTVFKKIFVPSIPLEHQTLNIFVELLYTLYTSSQDKFCPGLISIFQINSSEGLIGPL